MPSFMRATALFLTGFTLCGLGCAGLVAWMVPRAEVPLALETEEAESVVVVDVTVFPGLDDHTVLYGQDVHLEGGWVASIGPTGGPLPEGAEVVQGRGHTLLPGLVDAHVHLDGSPAPPWLPYRPDPEHHLRSWVASGITTVQDLGSEPFATKALVESVASGVQVGPRIRTTGAPITAPGGHPTVVIQSLLPWPLGSLIVGLIPQPTTPDEARTVVDQALELGADGIKVIRDVLPEGSTPVLEADLVRALIARAHERRVPAFVHVGGVEDAWVAAQADADVLAHLVYRGRIEADLAQELATRGTLVIPTLSSFRATLDLAGGALEPTELDRALHAPEVLASVTGPQGLQFRDQPALGVFAETLQAHAGEWGANIRALHEAGVPMLVGTDSALPGVWPGSSMHAEMRALVAEGLTPTEVLYGATGMLALELELPVRFGVLEEGGLAEAVLVRGDPTRNIEDAAEIVWVTRRGLRHRTTGAPR